MRSNSPVRWSDWLPQGFRRLSVKPIRRIRNAVRTCCQRQDLRQLALRATVSSLAYSRLISVTTKTSYHVGILANQQTVMADMRENLSDLMFLDRSPCSVCWPSWILGDCYIYRFAIEINLRAQQLHPTYTHTHNLNGSFFLSSSLTFLSQLTHSLRLQSCHHLLLLRNCLFLKTQRALFCDFLLWFLLYKRLYCNWIKIFGTAIWTSNFCFENLPCVPCFS